jgi:ferredoxin
LGLLISKSASRLFREIPAVGEVIDDGIMDAAILRDLDSNQAVVAVYDGAWSDYPRLLGEIRREGLNPFLYTPLDTLELRLASPHLSPERLVAGKYAAALASMAGKAPVRLSGDRRLTRRELLSKPLKGAVEYVPGPILLNSPICGSWRHCTACIEACPHSALEGKPPTLDPYKCTGCGVCTAACPFGLLIMPAYNVRALEYLLEKAREETRAPGVVVAICTSMLPAARGALEGLEGEGLGFPVLFVPIHCPGWFTEFHMLISASKGFDVVLACDDARMRECSDNGEPERWLEEMEPLGAVRGAVREAAGLAELLRGHRPRSRLVEGVESIITDKTAAYRILAAYDVDDAVFSSPIVGYPRVDEEKCLLCDACSNMCPYQALRIEDEGDTRKLVLRPEECTACGACEAACPYQALRLEYAFHRSILGTRHVLARDEIARCRRCGKPIGSMKHLKMLEKKLRESGVDEWVIEQLWLCQECKVRSLIERGGRPGS